MSVRANSSIIITTVKKVADSVMLLSQVLKRYGELDVAFVVVQNLGRGSDFTRFPKSDIYKMAQQLEADILELPKLQTKLTQKIDFNNSSFWAVANDRSIMNIAERQRMKVWLRNAYAQLAFLN